MWFPNRFDTNRPVQAQKMARGWKSKFGFRKKRDCTIRVAKTKALISSYCEADLRLCLSLCRLLVFPCGGYPLNVLEITEKEMATNMYNVNPA